MGNRLGQTGKRARSRPATVPTSRAAPDLRGNDGYGFDAHMSLGISVNKVIGVLLADGWHEVAGESFKLGSYEFLGSPEGQQQDGEPQLVHRAGDNGICAAGFQFAERIAALESESGPVRRHMLQISGPLTAVLAVRTLEERSLAENQTPGRSRA